MSSNEFVGAHGTLIIATEKYLTNTNPFAQYTAGPTHYWLNGVEITQDAARRILDELEHNQPEDTEMPRLAPPAPKPPTYCSCGCKRADHPRAARCRNCQCTTFNNPNERRWRAQL